MHYGDPQGTADAEVVSVSINADDPAAILISVTVDLTVTDAAGRTVDVDFSRFSVSSRSGTENLSNIRFLLAKLNPAADGEPSSWYRYAYERVPAQLARNVDGTWTYAFSPIDTTADPDAAWDATATHRLGFQISGLTDIDVANPTRDFRPDENDLVETRDIVTIDSCNECHGSLAFHGGGRVDTKLCVMCHNDSAEPLVDFKRFVHQIHSAKDVPEVADFSEVTFPQSVTNCRKCHTAENPATPDGDNWMLRPNRASCGACHDNVNFDDGTNHVGGRQLTNAMCANCHSPEDINRYHINTVASPNNPEVPPNVSNFAYELVAATVDADNNAVVDFSLLRDDAPMDVLALPADLTENNRYPGFLFAYAMPQDGASAPADYNNLGNTAGDAGSVGLNVLIDGGNVAATEVAGVFRATVADAFPAGATLRAVALQSYFSQTVDGATVARHTPSVVLAVEGDPERRQVVDSAKCLNCHESLELHGGSRMNNPQVCVMCHNPNKSSGGRGADPEGLPEATIAALGNDPLTFPETSMVMKNLVHGVHGSAERANDFQFVRNRAGGLYYDFAEVTFPGLLNRCETCHLPGTYGADLPDGLLLTTEVTTDGVNATWQDVNTAREAVPNATDLVSSPTASACSGCHDSALAISHFEQNGGVYHRPRAGALGE